MKTIKSIIILTMVTIFATTTYAAEVPRESAPYYATNGSIIMAENLIGDILTEARIEYNHIRFCSCIGVA